MRDQAFAAALLAMVPLAQSYQLAAFTEGSTISIGDNISVAWSVESECLLGLRAPAGWGEYMGWREGANWMEQVYSEAYAKGTVTATIGDISVSLTPKLLFWDLVFFMDIFMFFPPEHGEHSMSEAADEVAEGATDEENPNWCNFQGWAQEWFIFFLDVSVTTYECELETYSFIVDGVDPACHWVSYEVAELLELPFTDMYHSTSGQYEWGWNTCQGTKFNAYSTEEWGFMEGHPFQEEQEELEE